MSNGKLAIVWSCALLIGLVGILTASFFFFNRSSTEVNTESTQGDKLKALSERMSALLADAKSLLGLAQVLSLFGVTLQVRAHSHETTLRACATIATEVVLRTCARSADFHPVSFSRAAELVWLSVTGLLGGPQLGRATELRQYWRAL